MEEVPSLIKIGLIITRREAAAIQGHIGGDLIAPELMGHVAIPFNISPRMQVERKAENGDRLCSSFLWIPGEVG